MAKARGHTWRFKVRFRRHACGWKSQPAIARLHEAVSEITLVALWQRAVSEGKVAPGAITVTIDDGRGGRATRTFTSTLQ